MAELVDALDSKSCSGNGVWVRFPPRVQNVTPKYSGFFYPENWRLNILYAALDTILNKELPVFCNFVLFLG